MRQPCGATLPRVRILACDDHAVFREGLRHALAGLDAEFISTASAEEALARVAEPPPPDLVLLDLGLPGLDGWEAFERLRREHPDVPVVIVSSSETVEAMRRALDAGAAGFIPKSATLEVLRAAIELVRSGGVYVPSAALGSSAPPAPSRPSAPAGSSELTPRQVEVLRLLSRGLTNREIAELLGISESTVKTHLRTLFEVLDVSNRTEAAMRLRELGLGE